MKTKLKSKLYLFTCFVLMSFNSLAAFAHTHQALSGDSIIIAVTSLLNSNETTTKPDSIIELVVRNRKKLKQNYRYCLNLVKDKMKKEQNTAGLMKIYYRLGLDSRYEHAYDSAKYYYKKSLLHAEKTEDYNTIGRLYNELGTACRKTDHNYEAIDYFVRSIQYAKYDNNLFGKAIAENGIGNVYLVQKEYNKALYYFKESLKYAYASHNKYHLEISYGNLGEVYLYLHQADSAEHYIRQSLELAKQRNSSVGIGICHQLLGQIYAQQNQNQKAYQYYRTALELQRKKNDKRYLSSVLVHQGTICEKLKKYKEAEKKLLEGRALCTDIHSIDKLILANETLYRIYFETGKFEKACNFLMEAKIYKDSLYNTESVRMLNDLEFKYQTEKGKHQIKLLTAENKIKQQRSLLLTISTLALLFALFIGVVDFIRRKKRNTQQQEALKQQLLRMQMNPHFLFNALGSIQNYLFKNETKKAAGYLNNFAALTRSILEHTTQNFISLADEISTLNNYLSLERMRTSNSFDYKLIYNNNADTEFIKLPPMMVQPFVENAIKHGFKNLGYPGLLSIEFEEKNTVLHITITDNGHGIQISKNLKKGTHRSMSMKIFEKRQKLLSKQLKKNIFFTVLNRNQQNNNLKGTVVQIQIPLKS